MRFAREITEAFANPTEELYPEEIAERIGSVRSKERTRAVSKFLLTLFDDDTQAYLRQPPIAQIERALKKLERQNIVRSHIHMEIFPRKRRYRLAPGRQIQ